jgi:hypothetical protein
MGGVPNASIVLLLPRATLVPDPFVFAQTRVRHFVGWASFAVLRWLLQAAPARALRKSFIDELSESPV